MAVTNAERQRYKQYEDTVVEYVKNANGHFIVLSDDQTFVTLLRLTLIKELGLSQPDIFTPIVDPTKLLRAIKDVSVKHPAPIVFLERIMGGRDLSFFVQQFKDAYADIRIIILTVDVHKERLMLLHEIGADNFIAKPVSANTLIEKIAFTLRPQNKLGQLIDEAKSLVNQGESQKALTLSLQILEAKPNSAAALLIKGDAYRGMNQFEDAQKAYEDAAKSADLFLEPLSRLAELHGEMGHADVRLHYLQKLDSLSPLNVNRKIDIGSLHLTMGNNELAEAVFDKAVTQATKEAMSQISSVSGRIATLYAEKDPLMAEKFLRKSLEVKGQFLSISDINTFNQLGISLRRQGRWKDAVTEYGRALKIAPSDENLYYNMGMAYAEGKDFQQARANMLKALELSPDLPRANANIACNIGIVFLQAGSRERATQCFKLALEIDPAHEVARKSLARTQKI